MTKKTFHIRLIIVLSGLFISILSMNCIQGKISDVQRGNIKAPDHGTPPQ